MRSRNIKPGLYKNEALASLSFAARYLFAGLPCMADRRGRLEDRPLKIKAEFFPMDSIDVDALLNELNNADDDLIIRYESNGKRYIQICNFEKHQHPHLKEVESVIPPCSSEKPSKGRCEHGARPGISRPSPADSFNLLPLTYNPHTDAEQKSLVDKPTKEHASKKQEPEHFDQFWKIYPRKVNRQGFFTFWMKNNLDQEAETIIASVQRHSMCEQWKAQNGQFIPHPLTYLRQQRYADLPMDVPSITAIPANALLDEKKAKRDALLNFPYIRLEGSLVESSRFSVDDAFPDRLYAFGCSYDISLLEGVSANE
jgi:hypothetical protein